MSGKENPQTNPYAAPESNVDNEPSWLAVVAPTREWCDVTKKLAGQIGRFELLFGTFSGVLGVGLYRSLADVWEGNVSGLPGNILVSLFVAGALSMGALSGSKLGTSRFVRKYTVKQFIVQQHTRMNAWWSQPIFMTLGMSVVLTIAIASIWVLELLMTGSESLPLIVALSIGLVYVALAFPVVRHSRHRTEKLLKEMALHIQQTDTTSDS